LRAHDLGDERKAVSVACLAPDGEALLAEPLEAVGVGAGLEGAATEEGHATRRDAFGDGEGLLARLDGARTRDEHGRAAAADLHGAHLDDRVVRVLVARHEVLTLLRTLRELHARLEHLLEEALDRGVVEGTAVRGDE